MRFSTQLGKQSLVHDKVWKLYFDGAYFREGNVEFVLLVSPGGSLIPLSFKLEFDAMNNVPEYEALMLGLHTAKNLNIGSLTMFGDSKLMVKKVKNQCHTKHPRLKSYMNKVWDLVENFFLPFNIQFFPKEKNRMVDSLVIYASNFKPPKNPFLTYEVEVIYMPLVLDNVKH